MITPLEALRTEWPVLLVAHTVKASLLLLAALAATSAMRRASAAARHLVWTVALTGVLVLPILTLALPGWRVAALPAAAAAATPAATGMAAATTVAPSHEPLASGQVADVSGARTAREATPRADRATSGSVAPTLAERAGALDWRTVLVLLWTLGVAVIVVRLVAGLTAVWWITRRATMMTDAGWLHLAHAIAKRLGMGRGVTLLEGDRRTVPMTWGVLQPVVWLPSDAERWTEERRALVLTHELAHVRRRDALTQWIAHLALACNWFNPLAWMAARRFRDERERACDDAVIALGARPDVYADHLLDIVRSLGAAGGPAPAMAMARRSQFEGRLLAILDAAGHRPSVSRVGTLATVVLALGLIVPLAAARPVAREAARRVGPATRAPEQPLAGRAPVKSGAPSSSEHDVGRADTLAWALRSSPRSLRSPTPAPAARATTSPGGRRLISLLREPQAADTVVRQVIAAAAEMASDGDKRDVLLAVLGRPQVDQSDLAALLNVAARMTSDGDKADVLRAALPRVSFLDAGTRAALFAGVASMASDGDRRDVLLALRPHVPLDEPAVRAAYLDAVNKMTSDGDRADVLVDVLDHAELSSAALGAVIRATAPITSDGDKSAVLTRAAAHRSLDAAGRQAYLAVARTITSDGDRAAALNALLSGGASASPRAAASASSAAAAAAASPAAASSSSSSYVSSGDGRLWTTELALDGSHHGQPEYTVSISAQKVRVNADGSRVEGFAPGGRLTITHTVLPGPGASSSVTRHLEMDAGHGVLPRRYTVNGAEHAWDADAQAWLTDVLRRWGAKPKS